MATVYRGVDTRLGVERAIKVLQPEFSRKRGILERFEREARIMAELEHPHIVRVHDMGREGDELFLVMSLSTGGSVQDRLDQQGPLPVLEAVDVTLGVLSALATAHERGVVHRDVKPQNVLLDPQGRALLTDFGVAADDRRRVTHTGSWMGTLGYMPPEQRGSANQVDGRSDLYAVGATLAAMLTRTEPSELHNPEAHAQLTELPPALAGFIQRCTRYRPDDRFPDASTASEALLAIREQLAHDPGLRLRGGAPGSVARTYTPTTIGSTAPEGSTASTLASGRAPLLALVAGLGLVGIGGLLSLAALGLLWLQWPAHDTPSTPANTEAVPHPRVAPARPDPVPTPAAVEPVPIAPAPEAGQGEPPPVGAPDAVEAPEPGADGSGEPGADEASAPEPDEAGEPQPGAGEVGSDEPTATEQVADALPRIKTVIASTPWSHLKIDGEERGQTKWIGELPAGPHEIELWREGGERIVRTLLVEGSEGFSWCWDFGEDAPCKRH